MISRKTKVETVKRRGKKEKRIDKMEKKFFLFFASKKSDKKEEKFWQIYMNFLVFQSR